MTDITFKTTPYAHQLKVYERSKDAEYFALLMEQRTGKTKPVLDTAAHLFLQGKVDGLLVIAPNGVHANWITDEVPTHLPLLPHQYSTYIFRAGKSELKSHRPLIEALFAPGKLAILAVNTEGLTKPTLRKLMTRFFKGRRIITAVDEADDFKGHKSKRTKLLWRIGQRSAYRRTLTGTPVTQSPFDHFGPCQFLKPGLLGHQTFTTFKHHYAEWEDGFNHNTDTEYEAIKRDDDGQPIYLHLDELSRRVAKFSFRITRAECADMPEKVYQKRPFQLSNEQRHAYEGLKEEYAAEIGGGSYPVAHVLTRVLRLQQIASNYWPAHKAVSVHSGCAGEGCDGCNDLGVVESTEPLRRISLVNPRIETLKHELEGNKRGRTIIWCRFQQDIEDVSNLLSDLNRSHGLYSGMQKSIDREKDKRAYLAGDLQDMVGTPSAGGRGVDMAVGDQTVIYYSNDFSLRKRLQSEDRAQSLKKKEPTGYVDIIAEDTVDDGLIIPSLRGKKNIADIVNRDPRRPFL